MTIKSYTDAQWLLGEARYTRRERAVTSRDGGALRAIDLLTDPSLRNASGACNTCHTAQAEIIQYEDTPLQTAGYTDNELITIFTRGAKPEWADTRPIPDFAWGQAHSWEVSEEEKQGLIAYLRTKQSKSQPPTGGSVRVCGDAGPNSLPLVCDLNGNIVLLPGQRGSDAGLTRTMDAGMSDGGF